MPRQNDVDKVLEMRARKLAEKARQDKQGIDIVQRGKQLTEKFDRQGASHNSSNKSEDSVKQRQKIKINKNLSNSDTSKLDTSKLDTSKLDTSSSDTSNSDTSNSDTSKLDTSKLGTSKLGTSKLGTSKLGTSKLGTSKLDTSKLDTSKLDTSKLDTSSSDTSKLDTSKLDTSNSDTSKLNTSNSDTSKLDTSNSDTSDLIFSHQNSYFRCKLEKAISSTITLRELRIYLYLLIRSEQNKDLFFKIINGEIADGSNCHVSHISKSMKNLEKIGLIKRKLGNRGAERNYCKII